MLTKVLAGITFKEGPDFARALDILDAFSDEDLLDKPEVVKVLREAGLKKPADEIEKMNALEWEDFIVNNLGED